MCRRSRVSGCPILELPKANEVHFTPGQALEHSRANIRFTAGNVPDTELVQLTVEIVVERRVKRFSVAAAQVVVAAFVDGGETAVNQVRPNQQAVQIKSHPT